MDKRPTISIAVPTHDMAEKEFFFKRLLDSLWNQSFQDFEIVVTDNSTDDKIETICDWYKTGISYFRNPNKGMAQNSNEAIKRSIGEYIKILYMDDFMADDDAILRIVKKLRKESPYWLAVACNHIDAFGKVGKIHYPDYNPDIQFGVNTIGSPSVVVIKNEDPLLFDEKMTWLLDCDLYKRYYDKYGEPVLMNDVCVSIGLHLGQATNTMGDARKLQEEKYIKQKYE